MSGIRLSKDFRHLDRALLRLGEETIFTRLHKRIAEAGVSSTKLRFEDQRGPDGARWIPSERVLRHGGQTLVDTGRLRRSITGRGDSARAQWGTNVVYAARHNYGDVIVRGRRAGGIPARPFIGINQDDWDEFKGIIAQTLAEEARG